MRINGTPMNTIPVNPYNAATEKAVTARRSTQLRKKLAKRAGANQAWAGLNQSSMMGEWMSAGRGQAPTKEQRNASGKESKIG